MYPEPIPQAVMAFVQLPFKFDDDGRGSTSRAVTPLLLPACFAVVSAFILLVRFVLSLTLVHNTLERLAVLSPLRTNSREPTPGIGKGVILVYRVARLLGCLSLFALSIVSYISVHGDEDGTGEWTRRARTDPVICLTYLYVSILAFLSTSTKHARGQLVRHVNCVLFVAFCIYLYRDVLPLATFAWTPEDLDQGPQLWAKIAILFITAVFIPLFTPRQYVPVDPMNPMQTPNPEQTASIFSFAFFFFLDHIIFLAYRNSEVKEEELYPLCDTDSSAHLKARSFPHLDIFSGSKRRHIFFGLMRIFRREFTILAGLLVFQVMSSFSRYLETKEQGAIIQPWVWILILFLGPTLGSLGFQFYIFINTRTLVRTEAIITQLVFAHSLRIRMQAETTATKKEADDSPTIGTPATISGGESEVDSADEAQSTTTFATGEGTPSSEPDSATVQASSSSVKSTGTKESAKISKDEPTKSQGSLIGKINNLVTTDLVDSRDFLFPVLYIPLQIACCIWFLHALLGWAVWVGFASIIVLAPAPGYSLCSSSIYSYDAQNISSGKISAVTVNVLRMVKLFGWEGKMSDRIAGKREEELAWIRKRRLLDLASNLVNFIIPIATMITLIMGEPLNASKVFSSMTVTFWLNQAVTGKVSLDRVNDFLLKTELLDAFDEKDSPVLFSSPAQVEERIGFRNATFSWSKDSETVGSLTRSQRRDFLLKIEEEVIFERGRINLVVGPTGSGKTSLLMALLGEMHWIPSSPDSWYNLPREAGVAYAAQESWVLNETIRDNITFDTPFDEERYKKVLYQCALEPDLALFQAGDKTEVGEKGLTLSGGQKARLTLARAVYSTASILLLDDVLAALDVHTAQWIVEKCFGGDLIKGRTVILVTHNIALAHPIAHFIVTFGSDGRVRSQGSISQVAKRGHLTAQLRKEQEVLDKTDQEIDSPAPVPNTDGKLIVAEEIQEGHVSASALKMYLLAMAGQYPFLFFFSFFGGLLFNQIFVTLRTWILGIWALQYDYYPVEEVPVFYYMSLFVGIVSISTVALTVVYILLVFGQLRASKAIHKTLIKSVLSAPLRWLDVTPTSRIIARVTNDVRAVDDPIPNQFWSLSAMIISMLVKFGAVVVYTPIFFFPGVLVGALGGWIGQIYISAQLPVKRLMSNTRAPVLAHFGAAIAGLVSIRAFSAESKFKVESLSKIDRYTRAARNYYNLNRWVSIRVDLLGSLFSAGLATYLVYVKHSSASETGFLINMAVTFTGMLLWAVRVLNEFEVQASFEQHSHCISLERIQGYINIDHEKPATEAGKPPAYWPASGDLRVENLSARYSEDGPKVLHDISFHIKAGERVGIGITKNFRTESRLMNRQSSLTLSLLRCIPTEGSVTYDGISTSELNLDALRSSITIIPQVPELLSGSLRANLDPFGQYDDAELNYALRAAGLFALQSEMDEGRITLDSAISTGGSNLSVGQRQIFALARAIVRKSKILILDEATSAIGE
ncbi:hypothetical protein B0H10DRAFT_2015711 [Mycena sp. CBHHK59/15]|nr:hypothetical protein B0H10DRAFT_2015711 [Mycena sp. CBHHK59/15]